MPEAIDQRVHLAEVAALAGLELDLEHVPLPRDRYFDANGLRLHFLEWGESTARPIILLHGGALTAHTWDVVCLGLLPGFRCIAPDLRGHGDSAWAADGDYSTDAYRRDLAAGATCSTTKMPKSLPPRSTPGAGSESKMQATPFRAINPWRC